MKKKILALAKRTTSLLIDVHSVSMSFSYVSKAAPTQAKTKNMNLDVEGLVTKVSSSKAFQAIKNKISKSTSYEEDLNTMETYRYKVIWLDEMGNEMDSYHQDEADRNAKLQSLVDDGYSPVWRDIQ